MIILKDKLSHLSYVQACKLLGPQGKQILLAGGKYDLDSLKDKPIDNIKDLVRRIRMVEDLGVQVTIYPDAKEYINHRLFRKRIAETVADIRKDPKNHPLRTTLLKSELPPFQLDRIAFAARAGREHLADDMGLGKTVQGIGVATILG